MPDYPVATIPHPLGEISEEQVKERANYVLDEVIKILTGPRDELSTHYRGKYIEPRGSCRTCSDLSVSDSFDAAIRGLSIKDWTDGLPIVRPTESRVKKMLKFTDLDPQEVIASIPPKYLNAPVEKVAINSVMAGAAPEYFPIILTAIKALSENKFNLYAVQVTTHVCAPLILVNGPLAKELGVNYGHNAFGQGFRANATIGRAVQLTLINIGGAEPGLLDKSTFGQPAKFSYCVAENQEGNPWEPLHMERGFPEQTSTVTVMAAEGPHNINDHGSMNAEAVLQTIAGTMTGLGTNDLFFGGEPMVVLGLEHAAIIAKDGFSKEDIKRWLFEKARVDFSALVPRNLNRIKANRPRWFEDANNHSLPVVDDYRDIIVTVIGGAGKHSLYIPSFGETRSVTRAVIQRDGAPVSTVKEFLNTR
jgi:hypothetical protein